LLAALTFLSPAIQAASNQMPMPQRMGVRTNAAIGRPFARTNISTAVHPAPAAHGPGTRTNVFGSRTNAVPAKAAAPATSGWKDKLLQLKSYRLFYPVVGAVFVGLAALFGFIAFRSKGQKATDKTGAKTALVPVSKVAAKPARRRGPITYHSCTVLEIGPEARQVWQFDARGRGYVLNRQHTSLDGEKLPGGIVAKDWRSLFQHKLNVAWLPPEQVFLKVAQLPRSDFEETLSMVELQLEKLSPLPVTQIVWSFQTLPHAEANLQTVIVSMVSRNVVEEFLGKLEGQGYLADRLELPLLDQLQTTALTEDGAWVYPEAAGGKNTAVVAWWYGGVLRNLDLLTMPTGEGDRAAALKEQLMQMAWAGEMEGWLSGPPEWHLVADVSAKEWEPALRAGLEQPVETVTPLSTRELAALTAERSAHGEPRANLMPAEFATRYQQQFVDRLWMRSLLAIGGLYTIGVAIYLIALWFFNFTTTSVETQAAALAPNYTNALQLKVRFNLLKDRQELKYAGLDCWNATARLLPDNVTLDSLNFSEGKRLRLSGTAPESAYQRLLDFDRDLRRYIKPGENEPLFDATKGENLQWRAPGPTASWSVGLELKRSEVQ
jgi:hypothetical protein